MNQLNKSELEGKQVMIKTNLQINFLLSFQWKTRATTAPQIRVWICFDFKAGSDHFLFVVDCAAVDEVHSYIVN